MCEALERFERPSATPGNASRRCEASPRSNSCARSSSRDGRGGGELMDIAEQEGDPALLSDAHLLTGISSGWLDDLSVAIEHADKAVALLRSDDVGLRRVPRRAEPRRGRQRRLRADPVDGGLRRQRRGPHGATRSASPGSSSTRRRPPMRSITPTSWTCGGWTLASVACRAEELLRVADAHDYPIWRALALVFHGTATVQSGDADAGLAELEQGFVLYSELSTPPIFWPAVLLIRATAYGMTGQVERALELLHESEASVQGNDPVAADIAMAHGDLLLALPTPDLSAAEARFEQAAAIAGSRKARMVELEALTRLAAVRRGAPHQEDTVRRLRQLYDTFTEGFDSLQLAAARAVLDESG